jgi:uncharacterized protein YutE (UPF0331/DUF86 family)
VFITQTLRDKVTAIVAELEVRSQWLQATSERADAWHKDESLRWAAERALHVAIECSTDAANEIIDALVMREPGGYADIIRVLMEEGVVTRTWFHQFEGALAFRDKLVHAYVALSPEDVHDAVQAYGSLFSSYVKMLKAYLEIH